MGQAITVPETITLREEAERPFNDFYLVAELFTSNHVGEESEIPKWTEIAQEIQQIWTYNRFDQIRRRELACRLRDSLPGRREEGTSSLIQSASVTNSHDSRIKVFNVNRYEYGISIPESRLFFDPNEEIEVSDFLSDLFNALIERNTAVAIASDIRANLGRDSAQAALTLGVLTPYKVFMMQSRKNKLNSRKKETINRLLFPENTRG